MKDILGIVLVLAFAVIPVITGFCIWLILWLKDNPSISRLARKHRRRAE